MAFIVRRKDPPPYSGAKTWWQTVARRKTLVEAREAMAILKNYAKTGTIWWCGEETADSEDQKTKKGDI